MVNPPKLQVLADRASPMQPEWIRAGRPGSIRREICRFERHGGFQKDRPKQEARHPKSQPPGAEDLTFRWCRRTTVVLAGSTIVLGDRIPRFITIRPIRSQLETPRSTEKGTNTICPGGAIQKPPERGRSVHMLSVAPACLSFAAEIRACRLVDRTIYGPNTNQG
ncbi:uncharacterized protein P884DRAFT_269493 [Thermothelomyces heterothallicus CBS 202.75]|uniref:uncharacterized protein n=1 Tax=Thermothelomyces heterothallicus CBS 202.75 TaxID=1149848 RepID=UPI003742CF1E